MIPDLILILICLQIKHLFVDWFWQPPYEWRNKGTYGHWGGIRHSLKNAIGTTLCFVPFVPNLILITFILVIDFLVHYHVDWAKMNINRNMGWTATENPEFWYLTGTDQWFHQMCYILLIYIALF